ncbi:DNA repair protein RecO [Pikeienuella sp. HZG-20]|uniref:DNA repair protein RecO n=1 Tax=Paludibacillus litoralis TaxID=3133267 RepID=UPI0030EF8E27
MEWRDEGVLLTVRRHGEDAAILDVMTRDHGRHAGIVRGGASRRMAPLLQPGAQLSLEWRARLDAHLGAYRVELARSRAAGLMASGDALAALAAIAALLCAYLAEREPHPALYAATTGLLDRICSDADWPAGYVGWEVMLLAEIGYPLDLSVCAATGATEDLVWVSPRTGRAISAAAGAPYAPKLLALPAFFTGGAADAAGLAEGLALTGHFLRRWVAPAFGASAPPAARDRLVERLLRRRDRSD